MKRKPRKKWGTQKFGSLIWPWGKFLVQSSRMIFTSGCRKPVVKKITSYFAILKK